MLNAERFTQTFFVIRAPKSTTNVEIGREVKAILADMKEEQILHIVQQNQYTGEYGHPQTATTYLFYRGSDAVDVMGVLMAHLGIEIDYEWDIDETEESPDEIEIDETPVEDTWRVEKVVLELNVRIS